MGKRVIYDMYLITSSAKLPVYAVCLDLNVALVTFTSVTM